MVSQLAHYRLQSCEPDRRQIGRVGRRVCAVRQDRDGIMSAISGSVNSIVDEGKETGSHLKTLQAFNWAGIIRKTLARTPTSIDWARASKIGIVGNN